MSTLEKRGIEAVRSWTVKKRVDIFQKKLIFIPVNAAKHWSLLVVVNPGWIARSYCPYMVATEERSMYVLHVLQVCFLSYYCTQPHTNIDLFFMKFAVFGFNENAFQRKICKAYSRMAEF